MSRRSTISEKVKYRLWVLAGGRCEFDNCNEPLWRDSLTMGQMNRAYIAHIYGVEPSSTRYDPVLSPQFATDISNLMLLCDTHHRLIDTEKPQEYTVERLQIMKRSHERRIELLTSIKEDKASHILIYGAKIGLHDVSLSWEKAASAIVPYRYPAEPQCIELGMTNTSHQDSSVSYWDIERKHLQQMFESRIRPRLASGEIQHLSVFALAPQPLLIELGRLISDIPMADIYQLHREPQGWIWQPDETKLELQIQEPEDRHEIVALNISLSARIDNSRIIRDMNVDHSIWTLTAKNPGNDLIKCKEHLAQARSALRDMFERIKYEHGPTTTIHLFPAMPASVAVELGRVWMPKADLPLHIYDEGRTGDGFTYALSLD
ncbi:MAG: SAVED domain-containing protein [Actinomycetia bacterium]|nr:SAVED domain-containing protein [Actinomycetes bacterium]